MANYTVSSAVNKMAEHMAVMYYYLTKAMVEDFGEEAKETIRRAIIAFGHERGRKIRDEVLRNGEALTIENLDKYYDIPIEDGWSPKRTYEQDRKWNQTDACIFAEVWKERDWAEIGHIYCLVDTAIREGYSEGHNPKVVFHPGKNLLMGDDCCTSLTDYRQEQERTGEEESHE